MAYNAVVSVVWVGQTEISVMITETGAALADEATVDVASAALGPGIPLVGAVLRQICVRQVGTATSINPVLREVPAADPTASVRVICENDPNNQPNPLIVDTEGVAVFDDLTPSPLGPWGRGFHQSRPNLGADNTIVSVYRIRTGW